MSLNAEDISWYSRVYENVKLILNYGDFPNVPLLDTKKRESTTTRGWHCDILDTPW